MFSAFSLQHVELLQQGCHLQYDNRSRTLTGRIYKPGNRSRARHRFVESLLGGFNKNRLSPFKFSINILTPANQILDLLSYRGKLTSNGRSILEKRLWDFWILYRRWYQSCERIVEIADYFCKFSLEEFKACKSSLAPYPKTEDSRPSVSIILRGFFEVMHRQLVEKRRLETKDRVMQPGN
jgi:hypothetical protein